MHNKTKTNTEPPQIFRGTLIMNQQQCKILYDFGGHLENMQISSIRRHFSACKHWFSDLAYQITLKKCVRPHVFRNKSKLDTLKFVFRDSVFREYKAISPFFKYGATNF